MVEIDGANGEGGGQVLLKGDLILFSRVVRMFNGVRSGTISKNAGCH